MKKKLGAIILVLVLAVSLGVVPATIVSAVEDPEYIYGTERFSGDIYEIDVANGTYTQLVDISTLSVTPAINPIGSSSPNGNALDIATMRFYFASFLDPGSPPSSSVAVSELYFVDLDALSLSIVHAGTLSGHASDASFYDGSYWYVGHGTDELQEVTLNPDGTIASETTAENNISSGIANTTGYLGFGDIAFDLDGMLYVSATLRNSSNAILRFPFGTYDMTSDTFTDLGNNSGVQVAFGSDGVLYGHSAGLGEFYTIDTTTGVMSAPIFDHDRLFTDLASGQAPDEPFTTNLCAGQDIDIGNTIVENDGTNLSVTYEITEPGWLLTETHLEVVTDPDDFPLAKSKKAKNPMPGHFTWSEDHNPPVDTYTYTILLDDIGDGVSAGDPVYIAAHAAVVFLDETCIDFESYSEFNTVGTVGTPNGDVNFYMTGYTPLATLNVGDYAALTPSGSFPVVASPGTNDSPPGTYPNIVAFTTGGPPYTGADDIVLDDHGTGAGGNTLTDPQYQDAPEGELMWHAYSQFLGIVIDVTGLDWVEDMGLVTIDLDHGELWHFLYFDADGILIHKDTIAAGTGNYDGEAFPISWTDDEYSIAKVVVFGEMNNNNAGIVGYAIDNICITSVVQEETAWGGACDYTHYADDPFPDEDADDFVYFFNPDGKGNWASYFEYTIQ